MAGGGWAGASETVCASKMVINTRKFSAALRAAALRFFKIFAALRAASAAVLAAGGGRSPPPALRFFPKSEGPAAAALDVLKIGRSCKL